jgi:enolase
MPRVLVNVFSGGIHDPRARVPYQQIMVLPRTAHLCDDIRAAMSVYKAVEAYLAERGRTVRQSASSGMIVEGFAPTELLDLLCERIRRLGFRNDEISLALDVAAEHLKGADGLYELGDRRITGVELLEHHRRLLESYDIAYFEDPFDPEDTELWNALLQSAPIGTRIFGDDLFATNSRHLVTGLATGVVLKMSQVGTVTATLRTAANAERLGLALCVSHRSGETEDTSMCDLAVAVGAACIKVGGPRRGDRLSKYNQLLRLDEELNSASNTRTRDATNPDRIPVTVKGEPREANRANEATLDG